jgi:hypothetical protein
MAAGAGIAKAPPRPVLQPSATYYFSDPERTQYVGREVVNCDGIRYLEWGVRTPYTFVEPYDGCALGY